MDFSKNFSDLLAEFQRSTDPGKVNQMAADFREFQLALEKSVLPKGDPAQNEVRKGAQSKQFMVQILPTIQEYMRTFPRGHVFNILDVGPGVGSGANLLASLYQTSELGYRARVTTTDISARYMNYMKLFCRYVVPLNKNVFDLDRTFDIVIASHVVEHVPDWQPFVRRLKELSSGIVIVCAPYKENPATLTKGHVNIIDDEFLSTFEATNIDLVESPAWGLFLEPRYKMFIAKMNGLAKPAAPDGRKRG